jgi:hypothetical protein
VFLFEKGSRIRNVVDGRILTWRRSLNHINMPRDTPQGADSNKTFHNKKYGRGCQKACSQPRGRIGVCYKLNYFHKNPVTTRQLTLSNRVIQEMFINHLRE